MTRNTVDILLIDGRVVSLRVDLIPRMVIHRYTLLAIMLSFVVLFILKPYEYLSYSPTWFSAPFLFFSLLAMVFIFLAVLVGSARAFKLRRNITLPSSILAAAIMMFITDGLLLRFIGDPKMPLVFFMVKTLFTALFSELGFFFFFNFLYPMVIEELDGGAGPVDVEQGGTALATPQTETKSAALQILNIAGVSVPYSDLVCLEAEQSYVKIVTTGRTYVVRKKFSECIAKFPEHLGKQVHRSYWVSLGHVAHLQRVNAYTFQIVLKNGAVIPVSRGRTSEIEKWLSNSGISST